MNVFMAHLQPHLAPPSLLSNPGWRSASPLALQAHSDFSTHISHVLMIAPHSLDMNYLHLERQLPNSFAMFSGGDVKGGYSLLSSSYVLEDREEGKPDKMHVLAMVSMRTERQRRQGLGLADSLAEQTDIPLTSESSSFPLPRRAAGPLSSPPFLSALRGKDPFALYLGF